MFPAALCTPAKRGSSPNTHEIDGQTRCGIYTQWMLLFSLKQKGILIQPTTWMNLESIVLNEVNQTQKHTYCMIALK